LFKKLMLISVCSIAFATVTLAATEIRFDQKLADAFCKDKWTKRGNLDGRMFNYCMKKQAEGYGDAMDLYNKYKNIEPVELIDEVVAFALAKWAKPRKYQMNMVAYEIKKQGESYLNVAYELNAGNVGRPKFEACSSKWLRNNEPQWNMVEYCLDK